MYVNVQDMLDFFTYTNFLYIKEACTYYDWTIIPSVKFWSNSLSFAAMKSKHDIDYASYKLSVPDINKNLTLYRSYKKL